MLGKIFKKKPLALRIGDTAADFRVVVRWRGCHRVRRCRRRRRSHGWC